MFRIELTQITAYMAMIKLKSGQIFNSTIDLRLLKWNFISVIVTRENTFDFIISHDLCLIFNCNKLTCVLGADPAGGGVADSIPSLKS